MGTQCCCGEKMGRVGWKCDCDWEGWYLCYEQKEFPNVPIKKIPEKDGIYTVRVCEDADYNECESEFSIKEKNWGEDTNQAISNWKQQYYDGWCGWRGVFAWKENNANI